MNDTSATFQLHTFFPRPDPGNWCRKLGPSTLIRGAPRARASHQQPKHTANTRSSCGASRHAASPTSFPNLILPLAPSSIRYPRTPE